MNQNQTGNSDNRIKVMQVTRSLNVGGLEKLVALFAKKLDPNKFDVSVCCLLRKGFFADDLESQGIKIHLVKDEGEAESRFGFLKLVKLLKQERPQILQTHNTHAMMDGTVAAKLAGIPIVVHTDHARSFPDQTKYMVIENILSRMVDRVIAVSEYSKQDLVNFEKINPKKIDVIPNGVSFDKGEYDADAVKRELGLNQAEFVLGTVSRLTDQKGTKYLIAAMPAILEAYPNVMLAIVGDGVEREALEAQVKSLGIEDKVRFFGYQKEVQKYISAIDLFVSSSIWEGMPLGLLEVMSCAKPIVGTAVGGVPEVVAEGETGYLTSKENPEGLSAAVIKALSDKQKLLAMGQAAAVRYEQNFTESIMVENYEKLFLELARKKRLVV